MKTDKTIALPPNSVVGRWKPTQLLGQGGQGAVWAAKPVGVKHTPQRALKACFAADDQGRKRFEREVETLMRCESPNILKVHDHDLTWKEWVSGLPPFAFYVAEKCEGSLIQRQAMLGDARRRIALFRQACAAVNYLHTKLDPVIHRDIKPDNFLITQESESVVLADFGLARSASDGALTQAFEIVGTPYYRAPEVANGAPASNESDIYSLGRLLEWLFTGDVSKDMGTRAVPRGLELDDNACNLLDGIISRATQVTASQRYRSVQALIDQLPDLWIAVKPRPQPAAQLPDTRGSTVVPLALSLARANDQMGWRQLQNELRRDMGERLPAWRAENERKWAGDRNRGGAEQFTDAVLDISMARFVFSLVGVFSNNPSFTDQRSVIEDLLALPNWNRGGTTAIIDAPRTLAFVFQYMHGILCASYGQTDLALQLSAMPVPVNDSNRTRPLWKDDGLVGWPLLLGGNSLWAWEYVQKLRAKRPVLEQFFALQNDYDVGLAGYSMLLVLCELADDAVTASPEAIAQETGFRMNIPALFVTMPRDVIATADRRTFGNAALVARVAERAGAKVDTMRKLWPGRKRLIFEFARKAFERWFFSDEQLLSEQLG